ncbi:peptide ABC transporter substrate-binding protein, partial [Vibrio parahaemolyticus]|nr:peptide ABC transporter substrate-binding protein [Vibrio parahaemolyticus]
LDSAISTDNNSNYVIEHLFATLYRQTSDGKFEKDLVEKEEAGADGKEYTFYLKKGLKWSDGSPLTAKDFEFAWKRILNPKTGSMNATELYFIKGGEAFNTGKGAEDAVGIQAVDDVTLKLQFEHPVTSIKRTLAQSLYIPLNKKSIDEKGKLKVNPKELITNGPFTLKEWKHNQAIILEKNKEFHDKKVASKEIEFRIIPEGKTAYQLYKSGELDLLSNIPTDLVEKEQKNKEFKKMQDYSTHIYSFNSEKPPFTNAKIRKAFAL